MGTHYTLHTTVHPLPPFLPLLIPIPSGHFVGHFGPRDDRTTHQTQAVRRMAGVAGFPEGPWTATPFPRHRSPLGQLVGHFGARGGTLVAQEPLIVHQRPCMARGAWSGRAVAPPPSNAREAVCVALRRKRKARRSPPPTKPKPRGGEG